MIKSQNSRLKILITTGIFPPDIGGPASYSRVVAKKLSEVFDITLITYSWAWKDSQDKDLPFKVVRVWKKIPKFLRHLFFLIKVFSEAKNSDLVFSMNAVSSGIPSLIASRILKKKFFLKIVGDYAWEIAVNKNKTSLMLDDFQKVKKRGWIAILDSFQTWVCKNAEAVIVPSEYLAKIVKGWGVPQEKITVIYNGIDFRPSLLNKEEARKKIGISGNIILSMGRFVPWKGFRMLIKIMLQLLSINQFFRLVIAGDGPDRKNLEAMIKNLNLERKVYLVGRRSQEDLAIFLAAADIFVLNTGYEGFSHQILEAMAAGVPVITTRVGGNREIIHQGENGFMIKYNDEFNLVESIKALWENEEIRERFSKEGKEAVKFFSLDKMLKSTVKILKG